MAKIKKIGEKKVFQGKIVDLYEDYLELPNGKQVVYDLIKHPGGAAVLPVTEEGEFLFVKQYRNALGMEVLEIPAGLKEKEDVDGSICAMRELEEEVGYTTNSLEFVARIYGAIGISNEKTDIYLARNLKKGQQHLDPEEFLEVISIKPQVAYKMIEEQKIIDAKTIVAILYYRNYYDS